MTNSYYNKTFDVVPGVRIGSQSVEDQFLLIEQGFDGIETELDAEILLRGRIAGQAWTGAHTFPTQTLGDSSTLAATTSFVAQGLALKANVANPSFTGNATVEGSITVGGGSVIPGFAPLASPAFTGSPTAPTAAIATSNAQLATTQFVKDVFGTVPSGSLPALAGNAGKSLRVDSGETGVQWAYANIGTVVTATTATTLTSTPTLLQITPASYGVTVTLPDATTCPLGGPLHCIDNRGAYPVRVVNSAGVLKAFVFAGVVSNISLSDNSTLETSGAPGELALTPDFATDTNWTKGTGWVIGSGVATKTAGTASDLTQNMTCVVGKTYRLSFDVTRSAGTLNLVIFGITQFAVALSATRDFTFVANNTSQTINFSADSSFAGTVDNVSVRLVDQDRRWAIENGELVGASAQLLTTNMPQVGTCIDLGSGREMLLTVQGSGNNTPAYAVVYDRTTNTFGSVVLIRATNVYGAACLSAANQVLVVTCGATTAFEAVVLSVSGTTITVNTAATATLSANRDQFADGCGLIAVGSSFVTSYTVATPAAQIRALSISGTTVTIGSASVLDGTASGLIAAAANHVIAVSTITTSLWTRPYLVSGSTLTAGTSTTTTSGTMTLSKLTALGTRWATVYIDGGAVFGGVVSLNATGNGTTTISTASVLSGGLADAILVGSSKVLFLGTNSGSNANILTDTAGTASAGTAISLSSETSRTCVYVSGTDVYVQDGGAATAMSWLAVSCSGASPVLVSRFTMSATNQHVSAFPASNAVLSRTQNGIYAANFAATTAPRSTSSNAWMQLHRGGVAGVVPNDKWPVINSSNYRGCVDSERWGASAQVAITKLECAV